MLSRHIALFLPHEVSNVNFLTVLLLIIVTLLVVVIGVYNGLVARRNGVANAFASLDAMLQKRYDLVPNLVATVRGYAAHEHETFERVAQLRAQSQSGDAKARLAANEQMSAAIAQLFALSESYPQLKASANFLHLQAALNEIEEQIGASRRAFNACVTDYNNAVETFPSSLVANATGFSKKTWFEIADAARHNPQVKI
jgi:LemA protein